MYFTMAEQAFNAREDLRTAERAFLKRRGWRYTSATPDSVWRYRKMFGDEVLLADHESAMGLENRADIEAEAANQRD